MKSPKRSQSISKRNSSRQRSPTQQRSPTRQSIQNGKSLPAKANYSKLAIGALGTAGTVGTIYQLAKSYKLGEKISQMITDILNSVARNEEQNILANLGLKRGDVQHNHEVLQTFIAQFITQNEQLIDALIQRNMDTLFKNKFGADELGGVDFTQFINTNRPWINATIQENANTLFRNKFGVNDVANIDLAPFINTNRPWIDATIQQNADTLFRNKLGADSVDELMRNKLGAVNITEFIKMYPWVAYMVLTPDLLDKMPVKNQLKMIDKEIDNYIRYSNSYIGRFPSGFPKAQEALENIMRNNCQNCDADDEDLLTDILDRITLHNGSIKDDKYIIRLNNVQDYEYE